jgi:hypothetical protein
MRVASLINLEYYENIFPFGTISSTALYAVADGMLSYSRLLLPFPDLVRMRDGHEFEHRAKVLLEW